MARENDENLLALLLAVERMDLDGPAQATTQEVRDAIADARDEPVSKGTWHGPGEEGPTKNRWTHSWLYSD